MPKPAAVVAAPTPGKEAPGTGTVPTTPCNAQYVLRVNVHYILRSNGGGNFDEEGDRGSQDMEIPGQQTWYQAPTPADPRGRPVVLADTNSNGYAFAKGMLWGAIGRLQNNRRMTLPVGNTTPNPFPQLSYVLNGVYFHRNDALYNYDHVNYYARPEGILARDQFDALGVNKGSELNVFIMAQNTNDNSLNYPPATYANYLYLTGGASGYGHSANNIWMKMGNLWRIHLYQRAIHGVDMTTTTSAAATFNHEVGHLLNLYHPSDPDNCADTPPSPLGNNVMESGGAQEALTPCQIGIMRNELTTRYPAAYRTCGCMPINAFFTLPACVSVQYLAYRNWVWLDARGSWADNGTTGNYSVQEVDQQNQAVLYQTGGPYPQTGISVPVYTTITGDPKRYKLVLRPNSRYRVILTLQNGCNTHSSTKYINTFCPPEPARGAAPVVALYPNPSTTGEFTLQSTGAPDGAPVVRNAQGAVVVIERLMSEHQAGGWTVTYRLAAPKAGLYFVETGTGATRTVKHLAIQ